MDSLEKIAQLQTTLAAAEPADEDSARLQQLLTLGGPVLGTMLPADPAVMDDYLLRLATWALETRSDEAPRYRVAAVDQGAEPEPAPAAPGLEGELAERADAVAAELKQPAPPEGSSEGGQ